MAILDETRNPIRRTPAISMGENARKESSANVIYVCLSILLAICEMDVEV